KRPIVPVHSFSLFSLFNQKQIFFFFALDLHRSRWLDRRRRVVDAPSSPAASRCGGSPTECDLGLFPGGLRGFSGLGLRTYVGRGGGSGGRASGVCSGLLRKSGGDRWVFAACLGDPFLDLMAFLRLQITGLVSHRFSTTLFGRRRTGLKLEPSWWRFSCRWLWDLRGR
ncbi:unnamed protein product, partial [Arabidopsis halleri]